MTKEEMATGFRAVDHTTALTSLSATWTLPAPKSKSRLSSGIRLSCSRSKQVITSLMSAAGLATTCVRWRPWWAARVA